MRAAHKAGFAQFTRTGSGPVVDRRIEVSALHKEGHEIPVELSVAAIRSGDSFVANAFMRDITERRRAQEELAALSRIDTLTQLPNRRSFLERLEEALARSRRSGRALALMYLDVDHFKQINDTHGHAVGDEVLVAFARRLQACVRSTDTVARLAGDEFVIILEGLNESSESSLVGDKIVAAMQEPMVLKQHRLRVTSSIGIAVIEAIAPGHESAFARLGRLTGDELISRADQALYEAKRAGRNRFALLDVA
jgi:diguanylate cyclase (GGDEF)-like protein